MVAPITPEIKPPGKTKSKERYLKRKRQRRKIKTKASGKANKADQNSDDENTHDENEELEVPDLPLVLTTQIEDTRPKKRRKVQDPNEVEVIPVDLNPPAGMTEVETDDVLASAPLGTLPVFPLPTLPNAPSKTSLALQGLDAGLLDAEIVQPDTVLSISQGSGVDPATKLSEKMRNRLRELGITELFAVQTRLLPFLLPEEPHSRGLYLPYNPQRDVCVSAPTGSGKTLAYALPIIETLSSRLVTRLRALIVLPTRDLVMQVRETFEALGKGRGLKIGTATGQHSFAHEQLQLVGNKSSFLYGGSSKVDILICTPGRLMDHLNETSNFSLQHLRFLVIDEADRLLAQSFQDWLVHVLAATRSTQAVDINSRGGETLWGDLPIADAVAPALLCSLPSDIPTFVTDKRESSCQKLLFSATLTRDPGKIAALELRDPKYFVIQGSKNIDTEESGVLDVVMEKFSMPSTLTEHMVICDSSRKPLMLFHLVHTHGVTNALVFTKSAESTTRLVRLFEFFEKERAAIAMAGAFKITVVRAYSSDLAPGERKTILEKFKAQEIHILVCSDLISRGIDISHVAHVVSYDAPVDMRKYVHRVGRTARAGRAGAAWSLVEEQEARHFKSMLREADHLEEVRRLRVSDKDVAPLLPFYETALDSLKAAYSRQA